MAARTLIRGLVAFLAACGVLVLLLSLWLLIESAGDASRFYQLQEFILFVNVAGVAALLVLIIGNMVRLAREYRRHMPGTRLKARMVAMFVVLAVVPVAFVYYFSLQFLNRGMDSYFDVEVEEGLTDALRLSRSALELRMSDYLAEVESIAATLADVSEGSMVAIVSRLQRASVAIELTVLGANSRILATSSDRPPTALPDMPGEDVLLQVSQGHSFVGLDPQAGGGFFVRAAVGLPKRSPMDESRLVQGLFPVTGRISDLAESVQRAYNRYGEAAYLRTPLKYSLSLTLTLVLLLSLLAAVWAAFLWSRRLVAPIQSLVAGTRAVAEGDFDTRLPIPGRDEIGFLVNSFNDMTRRLAETSDVARLSQQAVESERANLAAILARLTSGVIALERDLSVRIANSAAGSILGADLAKRVGQPLSAGGGEASEPLLEQFAAVIHHHAEAGDTEWRDEVVLRSDTGRRVLNTACAGLPGEDGASAGYVVVFDDITALLQAQRDAAWGEVARRLAHEIKNPLTPIQLSAERVRRRYLSMMSEADGQILDRSTHTIIQQVEAMKEMVNAFSEYARAPNLEIDRLDLNQLVSEVADLYRAREMDIALALELATDLGTIEADAGRLRQILHNLLRNAFDSLHEHGGGRVRMTTAAYREQGIDVVEVCVEDDGPGFQIDVDRIFDPYVTSKPRGTGLGLAIVKKLVEEHGGRIHAENRPDGGARVRVVLPRDDNSRGAYTQVRSAQQITGGNVA